MKEILKLIQIKGQEFSQLELFSFFKNTSISPRDRMLWVPYFAPFIMGFSELNKSVFRKETTNDKLQDIINRHTYEDEYHWMWFLEDIETLGLNKSLSFNDSLKFLWSEETKYTRRVCQQIAIHTGNAEPIIMIVAIQCIEETFKVGLSAVCSVIEELEKENGIKYNYFGENHTEVEKKHSHNSTDMELFLESIELTLEQSITAKKIVDLIFKLMTDCLNELLENVHCEIQKSRKLELKYSR